MVSILGVAWWCVYQRLTVHSYSYIDPILILSKSLLTLLLFSLLKLYLYIAPHPEDNPTTLTNKQPDILTILQLSQVIRIIQFIYDTLFQIEGVLVLFCSYLSRQVLQSCSRVSVHICVFFRLRSEFFILKEIPYK